MKTNNTAIKVNNLSKHYNLGEIGASTFREALERKWHKLRGRDPDEHMGLIESGDPRDHYRTKKRGEIWALRDISFEVKRGEVIGIIGKNGAGKSTLLKLLTRITEPTGGRAELYGRVGSLLEVGTGFHGDLTGRENVYLNGTILGMSKAEIDDKFDSIVEFSGVEKFIDTPVKRYSSGMTVRLAFAVAAQLEPEIMLIDEVLAVGDIAFQQKCLGKMQDVSNSGRTILFVSHNMSSVLNLCPTTIYLKNGQIEEIGPSDRVIAKYLEDSTEKAKQNLSDRADRKGNGKFRFTGFEIVEPDGGAATGKSCVMRIHYDVPGPESLDEVSISMAIEKNGNAVIVFWTECLGANLNNVRGAGYIDCIVEKWPLVAGLYTVNLHCTEQGRLADWVTEAAEIPVQDAGYFDKGKPLKQGHPPIVVPYRWERV